MSAKRKFTFFYSDYLEVYIVIIFTSKGKRPQSNPKVTLRRIRFFKKKKAVYQVGKQQNIRLIKIEVFRGEHPIQILHKLLLSYLSGEKINLSKKIDKIGLNLAIDKEFSTLFQKKVISHLKSSVRYGALVAYSDIGKEINSKAYQAIGSTIKRNPYPIIIPCHRVIRKNKEIGGFMGKTGESWQTNVKKRLISLEKSNLK